MHSTLYTPIHFDMQNMFHIGYYSLLCSNVCGKIHSFEPLKFNYDTLKQNIQHNNINNVIVNTKAISDEQCSMNFTYGTSKICNDGKIKVDSINLSDYIKSANIQKIKLIKIDVEGYEMKVLKTLEKTLNKKIVQYIMCEVVENTFLDVCNLLKKYGYVNMFDLNTGFIFNKNSVNSTTFMSLGDILDDYKLENFTPRDCNILFSLN